MYSHVTLGTRDAAKAIPFYDAVLGLLGHKRFYGSADEGFAAWGEAQGDQIWVLPPFDGNPATVGNGTHVAFLAPTRKSVRDAYEIALSHGGSDEGPPGLREHYHADYYGAYFRDPDGNKLQVVCHLPTGQAGD